MALPARYTPHYTVEDHETWPGDWELWSGTAVAMSPSAKKIHQRLSKQLVKLLDGALERGGCTDCEALQNVDWRVGDDTVFRPDVSIVCSDWSSDYVQKAPAFIAEILSDSTREKDRHYKRQAYQSLGVVYYLMVEPEDSTLVLLQLVDGQYQEVIPDEPLLQLNEDCQVRVGLKRLFAQGRGM